MMLNIGWKKQVDRMRSMVLCAGPNLVKEIDPGTKTLFDAMRLFRRNGHQGDPPAMPDGDQPPPMTWEPVEVYGWNISATMYLADGASWWLVRAERKSTLPLNDKQRRVLAYVIDRLGGDVERDALSLSTLDVCIESECPYLWTFLNMQTLHMFQTHEVTHEMRIVPWGSRESDGYVNLTSKPREA